MKALKLFIISNLLMLHKAAAIKLSFTVPSWLLKIHASLMLSLPLAIPAWIIADLSDWSISNKGYLIGVGICIIIDHLIGSWYHAFIVKDFSLKRNGKGLLLKLSMCAAAVGLFEIIHNTIKEATIVYDYLKMVTRLVVLLYPAGSAFMNMSAITGGRFPPLGWIKKITAFNENLDLDKFKNTKSEENENIS